MSIKLLATALGCAGLAGMQEELGHKGKSNTEFFGLPTVGDSVEDWWNNATWEVRTEIGGMLVHYNVMSASCGWDGYSTFDKIGPSQKKRVKNAWKRRNEPYRMWDLGAMMGKLNRI
jgi:hypothetical protein